MIQQLIRRCVANDSEAWGEMWSLFETVARPAIKRNLGLWSRDLATVDDAVQDFYIHLTEKQCANLRRFRGESASQFGAFLCQAARNFAWDWSAHRSSLSRQETAAMRQTPTSDRNGPTAEQVRLAAESLGEEL
jgi:hypothetical protein